MAEFEKLGACKRTGCSGSYVGGACNRCGGSADVAEVSATAERLPGMQIDRSKIVDVYGNPLKYGKDPADTTILGPDDAVPAVTQGIAPGTLRDHSLYPSLFPAALFLAEERYVLPMASFVAQNIVDVDLIDEKTYAKLQKQLRERSIFCVLDISSPIVHDGKVRWPGFRILCKEFEVAAVNFQLDVALNLTITTHVRLWESKNQRYANVGDQSYLKDLTREKAAGLLDNYLYQEEILK